MSVTIYHNSKCSKCRIGIKVLKEYTKDFKVVEYLKDETFTEGFFREILKKLDMKPMDLMRTNESEYKEKVEGQDLSDDALITLMVENPNLIQRPIVVRDDKAVLARPVENLSNLF